MHIRDVAIWNGSGGGGNAACDGFLRQLGAYPRATCPFVLTLRFGSSCVLFVHVYIPCGGADLTGHYT